MIMDFPLFHLPGMQDTSGYGFYSGPRGYRSDLTEGDSAPKPDNSNKLAAWGISSNFQNSPAELPDSLAIVAFPLVGPWSPGGKSDDPGAWLPKAGPLRKKEQRTSLWRGILRRLVRQAGSQNPFQ
jgi:hypothetical protein